MKSRIVYAAAAAAVAAAALLGTVGLCCAAQDRTPVTVGIPGISDTVDEFCSSLETGDYAAIEEMIYNYSSVGLDQQPESESTAALLECLRSSFACTAEGEGRVEGVNAEQDLTVSYFSAWAAEENVRARAQELYDQRLAAAESNEDLYDESGNLLESVAYEIYEQALEEIMANASEYTVTEKVTMELVYSDGRWQIVLSDQMVEILLGGMNRN